MFGLLLVIFVIDIILLIVVILLQSGSGAQSGMFGNDLAMGAFGAKTSEVMIKATKWMVGIFFAVCFLMAYIKVQEYKGLVRTRNTQQIEHQRQAAEQQSNANAASNAAAATNGTPSMLPNAVSTNLPPLSK
jgi:preprotein translocase subunit SecG